MWLCWFFLLIDKMFKVFKEQLKVLSRLNCKHHFKFAYTTPTWFEKNNNIRNEDLQSSISILLGGDTFYRLSIYMYGY